MTISRIANALASVARRGRLIVPPDERREPLQATPLRSRRPHPDGSIQEGPIAAVPVQQSATTGQRANVQNPTCQNGMGATLDHLIDAAIKGQGRVGQKSCPGFRLDPVSTLVSRSTLGAVLAGKPLCQRLMPGPKCRPAKCATAPQKRPTRRGAVDAGQNHRRIGGQGNSCGHHQPVRLVALTDRDQTACAHQAAHGSFERVGCGGRGCGDIHDAQIEQMRPDFQTTATVYLRRLCA